MFILVWIQLGYPIVIFMSGLQRVDPELYEAAGLDGANWWQKFRVVTLPSIILNCWWSSSPQPSAH